MFQANTITLTASQHLTTVQWTTLVLLPLCVLLWLTPLNQQGFLWLNATIALQPHAAFWAVLTNLGDGFFMYPLAMLLVWRHPKQQLGLLLTILLTVALVQLAKYGLDTNRPAAVLHNTTFVIAGPSLKSHSTPSGHAGTIFLLAWLTWLYQKPMAKVMMALALLAGLSRVVVGAHWPADVVLGAWVSLVCAALGVIGTEYLTASIKTGCFEHRQLNSVITTFINRIISRHTELLAGSSFIILGLITAVVLPVYDNGFQDFLVVYSLQWLLAGVALTIAMTTLRDLLKTYTASRGVSLSWHKPQLFRWGQRFIQFGLVGTSGFLVDMGLYALLSVVIGTPHLIARGCAYWVAATWNWLWNRTFTFADAVKSRKFPQWGKYLSMCLVSFIPNWGVYYLLTAYIPFFDRHKALALIAGVGAGTLFNFTMAASLIFSNKSPQHSKPFT